MCLVGKRCDYRKAVKSLMRKHHVTQRELAPVLGVTEQAVSNKFRGRANFTLRDLSRIADYFDVSLDYLTGRTDHAQPLEMLAK